MDNSNEVKADTATKLDAESAFEVKAGTTDESPVFESKSQSEVDENVLSTLDSEAQIDSIANELSGQLDDFQVYTASDEQLDDSSKDHTASTTVTEEQVESAIEEQVDAASNDENSSNNDGDAVKADAKSIGVENSDEKAVKADATSNDEGLANNDKDAVKADAASSDESLANSDKDAVKANAEAAKLKLENKQLRDTIQDLNAEIESLRSKLETKVRAEADLKNKLDSESKAKTKVENEFKSFKTHTEKLRADALQGLNMAKESLNSIKQKETDLKQREAELKAKEQTCAKLTEQTNKLHQQSVQELLEAKKQAGITLGDALEDLEKQKKLLAQDQLKIEADKQQLAVKIQSAVAAQQAWEESTRQFQESLKQQKEVSDEFYKSLYQSQLSQKDELIKSYDMQIKQLQGSNMQKDQLIAEHQKIFKNFNGYNPQAILQQLQSQRQEIMRLQTELTKYPSDLPQKYRAAEQNNMQLKSELQHNRNQVTEYQKYIQDLNFRLLEVKETQDMCQKFKSLYDAKCADFGMLMDELRRLKAEYGDKAEYEDRKKNIEKPIFVVNHNDFTVNQGDPNSEYDWLLHINNQCLSHGYQFPLRLLFAFHTSLKTSDCSPMTVLAGVSGTGKSKLPQLYSLFGGINFMSLPVQPNWDCQESMLGYFNAIDNVFDAQPVSRFLVQTQLEKDSAYSLANQVNMVLLDEMNLAHVELYFAEFLSKLELRRGLVKANDPDVDFNKLPFVNVKLGSNLEPYHLKLNTNVLWVGTMNEDETTKSLSDKVIDRSEVIYFPRPESLQLKLVANTNPVLPDAPENMLSMANWTSWIQDKDVDPNSHLRQQLDHYREIVEKINDALSNVGRALGYRVWLSIESYMLNYPSVVALKQQGKSDKLIDKALKIAFEDQVVQKIMPKLRGIETRGTARTNCLNKIGEILVANDLNLKEDFDLACTRGYGQFMWNTASYLGKAGICNDVGYVKE